MTPSVHWRRWTSRGSTSPSCSEPTRTCSPRSMISIRASPLRCAAPSMTAGCVLGRFPNLRMAFLEGNCSWLPWWLHRLDDQWQKYGGGEAVRLSALPSEYFKRQCWIGTDVDEDLLPTVIDDIGDDNI